MRIGRRRLWALGRAGWLVRFRERRRRGGRGRAGRGVGCWCRLCWCLGRGAVGCGGLRRYGGE